MAKFLMRRLLAAIVTVWFLATITFFAMHAVPGDPLTSDRAMSAEMHAKLQQEYGLDKPIFKQYSLYMINAVQGDFGISYVQNNRRVSDIIMQHFPVSALLGVLAIVIAATGAVLLGAVSARWHNKPIDRIVMLLVILSISVPGFVFAALAQLAILGLNKWAGLDVLPIAGWGGFSHMLVPALVLGLSTLAFLTRLMRSAFIDVANADFVRTARAKGLGEPRIFFMHILPNASLPMLTVLGPAIAAIATGGFVVELVFAIPGLGRYFVQAVQQLDYTVIMGTTIFYGAFLVFVVLLVDILYGVLDPRIRLS